MKKILIIITTAFLFSSCNKSESKINDEFINNKDVKETSFTDLSKNNYKGQLPYLNSIDGSDSNELSIKYNFKEKIFDKNTSWEYFDALYKDDLSITEKQNISYIILSTKDLISIYLKDKSNKKIENALLKHTQSLVDTKYIGYCLLYNCLESLSENNFNFVKENTTIILNYSKNDTFHSNAIKNNELMKDQKLNKYLLKIRENYDYIEKIRNLNK